MISTKKQIRSALKKCKACGQTKKATEFPKLGRQCKTCRVEEQRLRRRRLVVSGMCSADCGAPAVPGRKMCRECLDKDLARSRRRIKARKESGACTACSGLGVVAWGLCIDCYFKNMSNRHFGSVKNAGLIRSMLEAQDYTCPYTGLKLVLGSENPRHTPSLDHVVPLCKGGENSPGNMVWASRLANHMKWTESLGDFVEMCQIIVDFNKKRRV